MLEPACGWCEPVAGCVLILLLSIGSVEERYSSDPESWDSDIGIDRCRSIFCAREERRISSVEGTVDDEGFSLWDRFDRASLEVSRLDECLA